jgi:hypothetical protein
MRAWARNSACGSHLAALIASRWSEQRPWMVVSHRAMSFRWQHSQTSFFPLPSRQARCRRRRACRPAAAGPGGWAMTPVDYSKAERVVESRNMTGYQRLRNRATESRGRLSMSPRAEPCSGLQDGSAPGEAERISRRLKTLGGVAGGNMAVQAWCSDAGSIRVLLCVIRSWRGCRSPPAAVILCRRSVACLWRTGCRRGKLPPLYLSRSRQANNRPY